MRHTKCLLTPARALHRVLLLELASTSTSKTANSSSSTIFFQTPSAPRSTARLPTPLPSSALQFHTTCRSLRQFSKSPGAAPPKAANAKRLRNEQIPYAWVRLPNSEGLLGAPRQRDAVISELAQGMSLVMVAEPPDPLPEDALGRLAATCRIVDLAAEQAALEAAEEVQKRQAKQTKNLEINWAIAPHDLAHRARRLQDFLKKGLRVEILLARKKNTRQATLEESRALLESIQQIVADVPKTVEYKKMDGDVGGVLRLFYQGPAVKKVKKKKGKGEEGEGEEGENTDGEKKEGVAA
ncbi:hypothetical protein F4777DRAFT_426428 [Nemania sp. FL0916]|nr:hypothetical protein F4777DRAFT_426428 [Nemania sp. FL0916]